MTSAGLGQRLANSWRDRHYPNRKLDAARCGNRVMRMARKTAAGRGWAMQLLERKRPKVVAVALANKTARIAWAVMARGESYAARAA
jgi:hypothetical protein